MKKRYAFAGASDRGLGMYAQPLFNDFKDVADMVGVYDINVGRAHTFAEMSNPDMPVFEDFDTMIREAKPDYVIITCVDAYHSDYIIRSLELGCNVITEKPMTTDDEKCRAILAAEKKYGKEVIVTFNMRFNYFATEVWKLVHDGAIGDVYNVHFEWMLEGHGGHGTSYFHRWNARMAKSAGLLVHKSTHHFDMVNWIIDQKPVKVAAFGQLNSYGAKNAPFQGPRCSECEHAKECPYYKELDDFAIKFYKNNEKYDGYLKDGCVFADDIDIYDTMSVNVQYDGGAVMSYSLNANATYEGWRMVINGSKGRIEAMDYESGIASKAPYNEIKVYDHKDNVTVHQVAKVLAGHGGGDPLLREMIFRGGIKDEFNRRAGTEAGTASIMIGIAANKSIKEGRMITIQDLLD